MNMSPFLSINHSCDETLQWTKEQLVKRGLRPVQTFDLHAARLGLRDCPCPHHGTEDCDCQMVILLVYSEAIEPVTLILHGNDGQTWLSLSDALDQKIDSQTMTTIQEMLKANEPVSLLKDV